jgi:hypothetical protein
VHHGENVGTKNDYNFACVSTPGLFSAEAQSVRHIMV